MEQVSNAINTSEQLATLDKIKSNLPPLKILPLQGKISIPILDLDTSQRESEATTKNLNLLVDNQSLAFDKPSKLIMTTRLMNLSGPKAPID